MASKSAMKREMILDNAKQVFIRKGFNRVTMKDIIEECAISRGGVYLYFSKTDDIFMEVVKRHNRAKLEGIKDSIEKCTDFSRLIDDFFEEQREKLLNMDKSLYEAMIEFCHSHRHKTERDFCAEQFLNTKNVIIELLNVGRARGAVKTRNIDGLADTILYLIEGLRSLAVSSGITAELAEKQMDICKRLIYTEIFD